LWFCILWITGTSQSFTLLLHEVFLYRRESWAFQGVGGGTKGFRAPEYLLVIAARTQKFAYFSARYLNSNKERKTKKREKNKTTVDDVEFSEHKHVWRKKERTTTDQEQTKNTKERKIKEKKKKKGKTSS
jgi:hypothetical protein